MIARLRPRLRAVLLGLTVGVSLGLVSVTASMALDRAGALLPPAGPALIDATHLPPTLVAPGEKVVLRYDINCPAPTEIDSSGCAGSGTVFVRPGQSGPFAPLILSLNESAPEGRYSVQVPSAVASSPEGFSYYAVLRDETSGATLTLPAGGAAAPERALPFRNAVEIALGGIDFASTTAPDAEVARAAWGDGSADAGLEQGKQSRLGASSYAVSANGDVYLLDEAHRRVLRWSGAGGPTAVPLRIAPVQADLALGGDGSLHVLESPHAGSPSPVLRSFDRTGKPLGAVTLAERTAAAIDTVDGSVFTLSYPDGSWLPTVSGVDTGQVQALQPRSRFLNGRQGRPANAGRQVLLLRNGSETRLALVARSTVLRSWRITSPTDLGEIQLARPIGNGLLVVVHPHSEDRDQFLVLVLGATGVTRRFGVAADTWAETAPLSRFRLVGSSLYQLGSDNTAAFVHRFDLGGM